MIKPRMKIIKNIAILLFTTHFGELKTYHVRKESHQSFQLCYTGIDKIVKYNSQVRAIWPQYVEINLADGKTLRSCYGEKLSPGQSVYIYEYFKTDDDIEYKWVASSKEIEDDRMIYINLDILDEEERVVERLRIDPYFGRSKVVSLNEESH